MIEETSDDISAELRELSRGAKYCELQPKVFGKPIGTYFAELVGRKMVKRWRERKMDVRTDHRGDLCHED